MIPIGDSPAEGLTDSEVSISSISLEVSWFWSGTVAPRIGLVFYFYFFFQNTVQSTIDAGCRIKRMLYESIRRRMYVTSVSHGSLKICW